MKFQNFFATLSTKCRQLRHNPNPKVTLRRADKLFWLKDSSEKSFTKKEKVNARKKEMKYLHFTEGP